VRSRLTAIAGRIMLASPPGGHWPTLTLTATAEEERMTAYVISEIDVHDADTYREYVALVPATLEPFGGRFLVRGGEHETLDGEWRPHRLVVIEFPSADHARRWYQSEGYVAAAAIRRRASTGSVVLVEGAG
jgi:uncharacterized protein (DUF1330 family)